MMKAFCAGILFCISSSLGAQTYVLTQQIPLGGSGGWDYLYADSNARRLYVSHSSQVYVLNLDTKQKIGQLDGFQFVHGIITIPEFHIGFITDGKQNRIAIFDLSTLQVIKSIPTAENPNSMAYDHRTGRLFVGHKPSRTMTVIDAKTQAIVSSIPLDGVPEFPVSDGDHTIFVNIDDKSELAHIDTKTMKVLGYWSLGACRNPSGLAIDPIGHMLFSTCRNGMMAVVDARSGQVVDLPTIGTGPDAARFDAKTHRAFSSNGDGTMTVIAREGGHYKAAQVVATQKGGRTMALDEHTGTAFISTADFITPDPNTVPKGRPAPADGTFRLLVVAPMDR